MTSINQFVRENWPALWLYGACLILVYGLIVKQALSAAHMRRERRKRALSEWVRRQGMK